MKKTFLFAFSSTPFRPSQINLTAILKEKMGEKFHSGAAEITPIVNTAWIIQKLNEPNQTNFWKKRDQKVHQRTKYFV